MESTQEGFDKQIERTRTEEAVCQSDRQVHNQHKDRHACRRTVLHLTIMTSALSCGSSAFHTCHGQPQRHCHIRQICQFCRSLSFKFGRSDKQLTNNTRRVNWLMSIDASAFLQVEQAEDAVGTRLADNGLHSCKQVSKGQLFSNKNNATM